MHKITAEFVVDDIRDAEKIGVSIVTKLPFFPVSLEFVEEEEDE